MRKLGGDLAEFGNKRNTDYGSSPIICGRNVTMFVGSTTSSPQYNMILDQKDHV